MLQELDFIDDKNLKISYNYNCETNRVNYDFKLLAQEELQERRNDPKIIGLQSKIAKENSLAYVKRSNLPRDCYESWIANFRTKRMRRKILKLMMTEA